MKAKIHGTNRQGRLLLENRLLKAELRQSERYCNNYWKHIVWLKSSDEFKLIPGACPKCGNPDVGLDGSICARLFIVWCHNCDTMSVPSNEENGAIEAWNRGEVNFGEDEEDEDII